jgi:regulatory protein
MNQRITKMSVKKRAPNQFVVEFDGGVCCELLVETVGRFGLMAGVEVEESVLEEITRFDQGERCKQAAWRLLSLRPRSEVEMVRALRQRKYGKAVAEEVVATLAAKGYLDDEAYSHLLAKELSGKKMGPRRIVQKLRSRGVDRELADQAVEEFEDKDLQVEQARELAVKWNRRSKPEDPRKRQQTAAAYLFRRGYDAELVWAVVREVILAEDVD